MKNAKNRIKWKTRWWKSTLLSDLGKKYPDMIQVPEMVATYMWEHQIHVNPEQMTPEVFKL